MSPQALADAGIDLQELQSLLYGDCDGYGLANTGKERLGLFNEDFVYGEVSLPAVWDLLQAVGAKPGDVFYDLGCGTGKAVLFAGLLFEFAKCAGIEYLQELHDYAEHSLNRFHAYIEPLLPAGRPRPALSFIHGDLRDQDISDADIVFSHCTTWSDSLMDGVRDRAETLKPGAHIITVSRELPSQKCVYLGMVPVQMAWGAATGYLYQRM